MIDRYIHPLIKILWSQDNQTEIWKNLEIWVAEAWHKNKLITATDLKSIQKVKVNIQEWKNREQKTNHELAAFVDMLSAQCGPAGRWIHYGLTSNDILDSTTHYLMRETNKIFLQMLTSLRKELEIHALAEKKTLMIGRTHGMFAEPISVGYKFALWYAEIKRHQNTLINISHTIGVIKISGPTGMHPDIPLNVSEYIAQKMKMRVDYAANQLIVRDRLIATIQAWTNLTITIEKIAMEMRNLQRSEINEFQEPFSSGQKGSSAMPHKQNPWRSENICGLSRLFRNLAGAIDYTNLIWHERDLTNSAIERVSLSDLAHLLATMLTRITDIINGMKINYPGIQNNLKKGEIAAFSHRVLLHLIREHKMARDKAYYLVQKYALVAQKKHTSFQKLLETDPLLKNIQNKEWIKLWKPESFLQNIDKLYQRIFSQEKKPTAVK